MADEDEELPADELCHQLAHQVLGKYLGNDLEGMLKIIDGIGDPVVAMAVAVHVCWELDPNQITEFVSLLEQEIDDSEVDEEADDKDDDGEE